MLSERFVAASFVAEDMFAWVLADALAVVFLTDGWTFVGRVCLLEATNEDTDDRFEEALGVALLGDADRALSGLDGALFLASFLSEVGSEGKVGMLSAGLSEVFNRRCLIELVGAAAEVCGPDVKMLDVGRAGCLEESFGIVRIVDDLIKCFPTAGGVSSFFGPAIGVAVLDRSLGVLTVGGICAILAGLLCE